MSNLAAVGAKGLLAFSLVAGAAASAQGVSGLQPATPSDISSAASSCLASVQATGTDESVLLAQGWERATMRAEGRAVETALKIYGRKGANVVLMTAPGTGASGLCTVTARVESLDSFAAIAQAIGQNLNIEGKQSEAGAMLWFSGRKVVQLAQTGERAKPAVRVSVLHLTEKSK